MEIWLFNLQYTSVLKAQPPLSQDCLFPIYKFTCMWVTSPCLLGPRLYKLYNNMSLSCYYPPVSTTCLLVLEYKPTGVLNCLVVVWTLLVCWECGEGLLLRSTVGRRAAGGAETTTPCMQGSYRQDCVKFKDFSRQFSFKDFSRQSCIFKYFSSLWEPWHGST